MENSKMSVRKLTYASVFVAISVAINTLRIGGISFGGFPIILSGFAMGPAMGFTVGAVADIVGFIVRPSATGSFNPLFILTSALTGAIPILVVRALKDEYPNFKIWKIFLGILIGQVLTSVIMVPLFRALLYTGLPTFWGYMVKAAMKQAVSIPIYAVLVKSLIESMSRVIDFRL